MEMVIVWLVCIVAGVLIGDRKERGLSGLVWPLLLGPIGLVIVLALPNVKKEREQQREIALRQEQLAVQKEILAELRAQKPVTETDPPSMPDPGEFIPENLRPKLRRR